MAQSSSNIFHTLQVLFYLRENIVIPTRMIIQEVRKGKANPVVHKHGVGGRPNVIVEFICAKISKYNRNKK